MDLIHEFLTTTLTVAGGVVEPMRHGLEGLLPQAAGERFGLPEEFRIRLDETGEVPGSVDGRLGSPLLERLLHERLAAPPLAAVALPAELPRSLPASAPTLLNAVRTGAVESAHAVTRYLVVEIRVVPQADELRSALQSVCIRLEDGALVRPLALQSAYPVTLEPLRREEVRCAEQALAVWLRRQGPALMQPAIETIARRGRRDLERMAAYYASLDAEMAEAVRRARRDDERERRRSKRAALPADLAARRAQLCERLKPRLSGSLVAATLVASDTECFTIGVRRRTREGAVIVRYRAGDGTFEGPACACSTATLRFFLCDERLHVLCETCGQHGRLDPSRCHACTRPADEPSVVLIEDATRGT